MRKHMGLAFLGVAALVPGLVACSRKAEGPKREVVIPLLQKEADSLKADGERPSPGLGVKSTWKIEGVDVREQSGNETNPWVGTIRFKIVTETPDADGSVLTDQSEKRFEYVWNTTINKWIIQYVPPAPKPAP